MHFGESLHHEVADVRLEGHADLFALVRLELEHVQNASDFHFDEDRVVAGSKLHNVAELSRMEVLFRHGTEEMHTAFVDAQNHFGRQQTNGIGITSHGKERRIA